MAAAAGYEGRDLPIIQTERLAPLRDGLEELEMLAPLGDCFRERPRGRGGAVIALGAAVVS